MRPEQAQYQIDLTADRSYSESASYNNPPEQSLAAEKAGRRAEPEIQDGSFGFETQTDSMVIDVEAEDNRRDAGRNPDHGGRNLDHSYQPRRDERRNGNGRYEQYARDDRGDRGNRIDQRGPPPKEPRNFDARGNRDERGLYSDGLYQRSRGNGFR